MYTKKDFKVGQKLYYVSVYGKDKKIKEVKIEKIGNKLLHTEYREKIYIETLRQQTEYSATQFYVSKEAIAESDQAQKNWSEIQDIIRRHSFWSLTHQQIHDLHSAFKRILEE